jgi:hypothetical protein
MGVSHLVSGSGWGVPARLPSFPLQEGIMDSESQFFSDIEFSGTPDTLEEALSAYAMALDEYTRLCIHEGQPMYSLVEIPKIAVANAVLRLLDYPLAPTLPERWSRPRNYVRSPVDPAPYIKQAISATVRWEVFLRDDFKCVDCGARRNLSVDHIVPEIHGGAHEMHNFCTRCKSCNSKKGSKMPQVTV